MYRYFFKRLIDIIVSAIAIICLSPIQIVVTIWLYIANKGAGVLKPLIRGMYLSQPPYNVRNTSNC